MSTFAKIRDIIAATINVPAETITDSLAIGDIPQWYSMGNMAIIAAIEENTGIEFPIEDLFELKSVKALVDEIEKLS